MKKTTERQRRLRVFDSIADAVGWTPLVRLGPTVETLGWTVFAKIELMNPMGSVKDRIARYMMEKALEDGRMRPGGTVLEASSGNTAMGLAMMAVLHGLECKMVVRKQTSAAKLDALRALGVDLVLVDGELPPEDPESYNQTARNLARDLPDVFFPDQHNNRENNDAHYETTGPEIWEQMEGKIDWFVAGIGTGGTVSGVSRFLKEQDSQIKVAAVDVEGSVFTDHFHKGEAGRPHPYLLEGLGDEEVIQCPEFELIDEMFQVSDRDAFLATRELARKEAIFAGGSSGAALWGIRELHRKRGAEIPPDARIVTLFPDSGNRYLGNLYSDDWMRSHGLLPEEK
jgi:cystathionine beta-synthase